MILGKISGAMNRLLRSRRQANTHNMVIIFDINNPKNPKNVYIKTNKMYGNNDVIKGSFISRISI